MSGFAAIIERARHIRHDLHAHPELAYQEERTAGVIRAELDHMGIPWRSCAGTGTVADIAGGGDGLCIALRADIDALPMQEMAPIPHRSTHANRMHACGHDGHTASLLAAAAWLVAHAKRLPGPVRLLFQPAEEGGAGAARMIAEGALEGVARIYGYHNWPQYRFGTAACVAGPLMAANGSFTITLTGHGGHAAVPEDCRDPVVAGAALVQALQTIVSRQVPPQEACVISVTRFLAGTNDNIIPETAELGGTIRAPTVERREALCRRIRACATAIAAALEVDCDLAWDPHYPPVINHQEAATAAREALLGPVGIKALTAVGLPIMGAEDFSFYLEAIPGAFVLLGAGRADGPLEACHSPRFDFNDDLLPVAVRLFAALVGAPVPQ